MFKNLINKIEKMAKSKKEKSVVIESASNSNEIIKEKKPEIIVEKKLQHKTGDKISFHQNKHIHGVDVTISAIDEQTKQYIVQNPYGRQLSKQQIEKYKLSEKHAYVFVHESQLIKK